MRRCKVARGWTGRGWRVRLLAKASDLRRVSLYIDTANDNCGVDDDDEDGDAHDFDELSSLSFSPMK